MNLKPEEAAKLAEDLLDLGTSEEDAGELVGVGSGTVSLPGGRLGNYRVTRLVGTGGMGEVYEAEQDNPRRRVALKVIRSHLLSPEVRRRFEHEVRILGSLHHPGIAQIYEAGHFASQGLAAMAGEEPPTSPFFAMEFVEGEPLTSYAASRKLSARERLELFLRVCQAVEHAHQRGIIHRDLKPANILVTPPPAPGTDPKSASSLTDRLGQPKVLDFGVARATDVDVSVTSLRTEFGKLVGTLPYMSPEQAGGDAAELDTRSDVYALGVVLYELLSGKLPYDVKSGGGGAGVANALRVIKEADPAPLSTVDRVFRGDIETIVGKALEKERGRRYQSVGELAGDVRRYLADEPIVARPTGLVYELRKFAVRNRALVVGVGIAVAGLVAATSVSLVMAVQAANSSSRAVSAYESQSAATEFLHRLLRSPDPDRSGRSALVVDLLDDAVQQLDAGEVESLEVEWALRQSIGLAFLGLEQFGQAERALSRAQELSLQLFGEDDVRALNDQANIALLAFKKGDTAGGMELIEHNFHRRRELFGAHSIDAIGVASGVAVAMIESGRTSDAMEVLGEYLPASEQALGREHPVTLKLLALLGSGYVELGEYEKAEPILYDSLARLKSVSGPASAQTLSTMNTLAIVCRRNGRVDEAIGLYKEAIDLSEKVHGPLNTATFTWRVNLVQAIASKEGPAVAEQLIRPLIEEAEAALGQEHSMLFGMRHMLAGFLLRQKRPDEALGVLEQFVPVAERSLHPASPDLALYRRDYGAALIRVKRYEDSERNLLRAYEGLSAARGARHPWTIIAARNLASLYEATGNTAEAERFRSIAAEAPK